jgi:hypothetical protein
MGGLVELNIILLNRRSLYGDGVLLHFACISDKETMTSIGNL